MIEAKDICPDCNRAAYICGHYDRAIAAANARATVSRRCARCNATLDEASVDGHGERCLVVGDMVEWNVSVDDSIIGRITVVHETDAQVRVETKRGNPGPWKVGEHFWPFIRQLRRIPGPAPRVASGITLHCQGTAPDGKQCRETTPEPQGSLHWRCPAHADCKKCEVERKTKTPTDRPLYDGLPLEILVARDQLNRREDPNLNRREDPNLIGVFTFTPSQRAAVSAHWSAQLRARIDAARERERGRVQIDADPDDTPW